MGDPIIVTYGISVKDTDISAFIGYSLCKSPHLVAISFLGPNQKFLFGTPFIPVFAFFTGRIFYLDPIPANRTATATIIRNEMSENGEDGWRCVQFNRHPFSRNLQSFS